MKKSSPVTNFLSDSLFPVRKEPENQAKDPLATQVWRLYTKAKDTLPNGSRLENLTWRMMAMTLKKKNQERITSPPPADDTVTLLSCSAPPSNNHFNQNVLVYGSATSPLKVNNFYIYIYLNDSSFYMLVSLIITCQ